MCGIVAVALKQRPANEDQVRRACDCLRHRGPDGEGVWTSADGCVWLGHRRLSIVGESNGRQPLTNETGTITAVVNGEFYGYENIRRDLCRRGHVFATHSDSEILVHLYEELGVKALEQLRGEFAFVLWDAATGRIFAARDRFGIKPLFYAFNETGLLIASECKALFELGIAPRWDVASYLHQVFFSLPPAHTLFAGVRQLPPASYLLGGAADANVSKYWDLEYPTTDGIAEWDEATAVDALRSALEANVRLRVNQADSAVGCFLSGGIDSSMVFSMACRAAPGRVAALTVSFNGEGYDESAIAGRTALHVGASHIVVNASDSAMTDVLRDAVYHSEMVSMNGHGIARLLNAKAARDAGYKAILSGEGADELFGGYSFTQRDVAGLGQNAVPRGQGFESAAGAAVAARLGFVPCWLSNLWRIRAPMLKFLCPELRETVCGAGMAEDFLGYFDIAGQMTGRAPALQSLYLWSRSVLPNYILFAERLEMAHAIEGRLPFLDHTLFELARRFPVRLLTQGRMGKYILRRAAEPYVTSEVYRMQKHPFHAPPTCSDPTSAMHRLLREALAGDGGKLPAFLNYTALHETVRRLDGMSAMERAALDAPLMLALTTIILHERFVLAA